MTDPAKLPLSKAGDAGGDESSMEEADGLFLPPSTRVLMLAPVILGVCAAPYLLLVGEVLSGVVLLLMAGMLARWIHLAYIDPDSRFETRVQPAVSLAVLLLAITALPWMAGLRVLAHVGLVVGLTVLLRHYRARKRRQLDALPPAPDAAPSPDREPGPGPG